MKKVDFKKLVKAIGIIVMYLFVVPMIVGALLGPVVRKYDNLLITTLVNVLAYVIDLIIVFLIYKDSLKVDYKNFKNNIKMCFKTAIKNWGTGFVLMVICNLILVNIVGGLASNEQQNRDILSKLPVFSALAMVFFGPVLEEMAFRKGFKEVFKDKKLFLICTSLLFGAMHVIGSVDYSSINSFLNTSKQLLYILPYSLLGYYFGKAYYETDTIFTSIIAHMCHNGFAVLLIIVSTFLLK